MKKVYFLTTGIMILFTFCQLNLNAQPFTAQLSLQYYNSQCEDNAVFLEALPGDTSQYTHTWTCPGGNCPNQWMQDGPHAYFFSSFNQLLQEEYTVLITDKFTGDTSSASVFVVIYPKPAVYLSGSHTGCEGTTTIVKALDGIFGSNPYGPYTYSWDGAPPTSSDSVILTFGPNLGMCPDVYITNTYGCTEASSSIFWLYGSPTPQAAISASGPTTFCAGDSVRLVGEGTHNFYSLQNISYQWRKYQNNVNDVDSVFYAKGTGRYRCIIAASGCADTSNYIDVVANPLPVVTVNPNGQAGYCIGQPVTLAATSPTATSFSWKRNSIPINGQTNDSLIVGSPGRYKAVVHDANGCSRASSAVQVFGPPNNQVTASGPLSFCAGDSVILTAAPGYTYQWKKNNDSIPAPEGTNQSYTAKVAGKYKVMVTNIFNCTVASAVKQVIIPCRIANPEVSKLNWEVFPNPFQDNLMIRIPGLLESTCVVELYDLSGRLVLEREIINTDDAAMELSTGSLQNGMYMLHLMVNDVTFRSVIVKN